MTQQEYLNQLELELRRLNIQQPEEVLADYREHFAIGLADGKSEGEICKKLGDPATIAKAYQAENLFLKMEQAPLPKDRFTYFMQACGRLLILTPVNFILLMGPFFIIASLVFAGWLAALLLTTVSAKVVWHFMAFDASLPLGFWGAMASVFACLTITGLGLIGFMIMYFATKIIFELFARYVRWNVQFVKGTKA